MHAHTKIYVPPSLNNIKLNFVNNELNGVFKETIILHYTGVNFFFAGCTALNIFFPKSQNNFFFSFY